MTTAPEQEDIEIWGYCHGCRDIKPILPGPGFKLADHPGKDGRKCRRSGRQPDYICCPPHKPDDHEA